jgi:hypothetical protein
MKPIQNSFITVKFGTVVNLFLSYIYLILPTPTYPIFIEREPFFCSRKSFGSHHQSQPELFQIPRAQDPSLEKGGHISEVWIPTR